MKIALVVCGGLETLTGGYLYDRMLVAHLCRRGHQIEVFSYPAAAYGRHLMDNLSPSFAAALARVSCDVMIQDALAHPSLLLVNRYLKHRCGFPRIALAHMNLSAQPRPACRNRFYALAERALYQSVDGCIANSRTTLAHLTRWGSSRRPSIVAPPGGDRLGLIASRGRIIDRAEASGPLRLLFLGNVLPSKGLVPLLAALFQIPDVDWQLTVAGSLTMARSHVREVRRIIRHSEIGDRVRLTGPVVGTTLVRLLETSHLMVMPFSHEGFGMALVEGMAYGLPAVASCRGAARETVTSGVNGILVPPDSPDLVGSAVRRLAEDRRALVRMSICALDTFHRHPTWEETSGAVEGFLRRTAGC